jgi:tryptophanyl-tRNA synthetase
VSECARREAAPRASGRRAAELAKLQHQYDCSISSRLARPHERVCVTKELVENGLDNVADWISAGIDPEKNTIFIQSLVPEHAELYFSADGDAVPWLERVPTYKEQMEQLAEKDLSNLGFLGYPLLQTADVASTTRTSCRWARSGAAPRAVARSRPPLQQFYGELLVEPQPLLTPTPRLPGLDNRKMSKSYGNTIDLRTRPRTSSKKVRQMYTDPKRVRADIPGTVEGNPCSSTTTRSIRTATRSRISRRATARARSATSK